MEGIPMIDVVKHVDPKLPNLPEQYFEVDLEKNLLKLHVHCNYMPKNAKLVGEVRFSKSGNWFSTPLVTWTEEKTKKC